MSESERRYQECLASTDFHEVCRRGYDVGTVAAPDDVDIPPITITDLARFAPAPAAVTAEPGNLGVAGLPTNFVATASAHIRSGEIFGHPIRVRFTPASFVFHHGDDTSATRPAGGRTWQQLGQAQFTPTPTSHAYTARGTYAARADVVYAAEIDLGAGWFPVAGTLTTTGATQSIRVLEAHTALVAHTCAERPSAAGC